MRPAAAARAIAAATVLALAGCTASIAEPPSDDIEIETGSDYDLELGDGPRDAHAADENDGLNNLGGEATSGDASVTGSTAPALSDFHIAAQTLALGDTVSGTAYLEDPDGLGGMKLTLTLTGPSTAVVQSELKVGDRRTEAEVPVSFVVGNDWRAGVYELSLTAEDAQQNVSAPVHLTVGIGVSLSSDLPLAE